MSDINVGNYILHLAVLVLILIVYFFIGSSVLFFCKIAESGIMPTDPKKFPYILNSKRPFMDKAMDQAKSLFSGGSKAEVKPEDLNEPINYMTDIFVTNDPKTGEKMSQKIYISNEGENGRNLLIEMFREIMDSGTVSSSTAFLISVLFGIYAKSYNVYNMVFGILSKYLSETAIIIVGPIILILLLHSNTMLILQYVIVVVTNLSWFWKRNINTDERLPAKWESISIFFDTFSYFISFLWALVFMIVSIPWMLFCMPVSIIGPLLSLSGYKAKLQDEEVGATGLAKKVFSYNRITISSIFSILVIISAFKNLGQVGAIITILVVGLLFFGLIPSELFKKVIPGGLSPLKKGVIDEKVANDIQSKGTKKMMEMIKNVGNKFKKQNNNSKNDGEE